MADRHVDLTDRQATVLLAVVDREMELQGSAFTADRLREISAIMVGVSWEELAELHDALAGRPDDG